MLRCTLPKVLSSSYIFKCLLQGSSFASAVASGPSIDGLLYVLLRTGPYRCLMGCYAQGPDSLEAGQELYLQKGRCMPCIAQTAGAAQVLGQLKLSE